MIYKLGIEEMEPGKWLGWFFDTPGCFVRADSPPNLVIKAPEAMAEWAEWLNGVAPSEKIDNPASAQVTETFVTKSTVEDIQIHAFFEDDRRPLSPNETDHATWVLECSRNELTATIQRIPTHLFSTEIENEVFSTINGIIEHIALAEWWYYDKLDLAFDRRVMPTDPIAALAATRRQTISRMNELVDNRKIIDHEGELWSARKIIRRTIWHERVHTWHLQNRLMELIYKDKNLKS